MARDENIETWLKSHGATFDLQTIDLANVDRAASHRNQARISGPVMEETVILYASSMEQGDQFPPFVASKRKDGKYVVVDGNHRVAAYDLNDIAKAEAYILSNMTDTQRAVLTFEANTKHGLPTGLQERLRQAIHLVELGATQTDAARALGLPLRRVEAAVMQFQTDKRLQQMGIQRWDRIPATARRRLHSIHSEKVLRSVVELAIESKMTGMDVDNLVARVNAAPRGDEPRQLEIVNTEREARKTEISLTAGGRVGWSRQAAALGGALTRVMRLDAKALAADSIGEDMRLELQRRSLIAATHLRDLSDALGEPRPTEEPVVSARS